jgi:hypothetical protein
MEKSIAARTVTYDFARLMRGAHEVKCSQFGDEIIRHMRGAKKAAAPRRALGATSPKKKAPKRVRPKKPTRR